METCPKRCNASYSIGKIVENHIVQAEHIHTISIVCTQKYYQRLTHDCTYKEEEVETATNSRGYTSY
jgi:hypothetical protein